MKTDFLLYSIYSSTCPSICLSSRNIIYVFNFLRNGRRATIPGATRGNMYIFFEAPCSCTWQKSKISNDSKQVVNIYCGFLAVFILSFIWLSYISS